MTKFPRLNRQFKKLPDVFLIFSDLDGTFTPIDIMGEIDFVNVINEIQHKEKCAVKFIPVSGRPCGYVLRVLHDTRDKLKTERIHGVSEYGVAENGACIVNCCKTYELTYLGKPESKTVKGTISETIAKNEHQKILADETDKIFTCSIHILNEVKENMPVSEQFKVYHSVKSDIEKVVGPGTLAFAMSHNTMEVMPSEIKKSEGIKWVIEKYRKDYNIIGLLYAGDAENDKLAMQYVSHLAEIPGIHSHNFTPGNSQEAISSMAIEKWKRDNPAAHSHYVEKGTQDRFKGITELIRRAIAKGRFTGTGVRFWGTMDDCHPLHLKDIRNPDDHRTARKFITPAPSPRPSISEYQRKKTTSEVALATLQ